MESLAVSVHPQLSFSLQPRAKLPSSRRTSLRSTATSSGLPALRKSINTNINTRRRGWFVTVPRSSTKPNPTTTDGAAEPQKQASVAETPSTPSGSGSETESPAAASGDSIDNIGAELSRLRKEKEAADKVENPGFLQGVIEETKLIEWPAFGTVISTTGLVLAVIVVATFAILIVNAILAEVSDRVFQIDAVAQLWKL